MNQQPITVQEMAERFRKCASASVYDILDRMSFPNQCLSLGIKPLTYQMSIAGPAYTVRGSREPRSTAELPQAHKLENWGVFNAMFPGCVVVLNAEKDDQVGHWGEMMSYTARQRGATGVVIDGGIRDLVSLLRIPDWPVFVRYTSPIESAQRWRTDDYMVPIFMSGTLSQTVRVTPGDWIVGDADGVIVVPQEIAYEILLKVEEVEKREEGTRRDLAAGVSIQEVFARYERM